MVSLATFLKSLKVCLQFFLASTLLPVLMFLQLELGHQENW